MPKHDFGIMQSAPKVHERYDSYIPEEYNCISVDDDYIMPLLEKLRGVTLIPPESLGIIIEIIWRNHNLSDLMCLLKKAENENKYVIHYGI